VSGTPDKEDQTFKLRLGSYAALASSGCGAALGLARCTGAMSEAGPYEAASEALLIKPGGLVFGDSRRKDLGFPCASGRFEALELTEDGGHGVWPFHTSIGRNSLPLKEEAQEIAGLDGLNFGAQAFDSVAMDAREESTLAPLVLVCSGCRGVGYRRSETPSHREAFGLEGCQRNIDIRSGEAKRVGDARGGHGAQTLQAAADNFHPGVLLRPCFRIPGRHFDTGLKLCAREHGQE
jgi:hypothetical protein